MSPRTKHIAAVLALLALALFTAPSLTTPRSLAWCLAGWAVVLVALAFIIKRGPKWSSFTRSGTIVVALVIADLIWSRPTLADSAVVVAITLVGLWIASAQRTRPVLQYLYICRFAIAILVVFVGLGPICEWLAPAFLKNLLVLRWPALMGVVALSIVVAKGIVIPLDLAVRYGPIRSRVTTWPNASLVTGVFVQTIASDVLAAPLIFFLVRRCDDYVQGRPLIAAATGYALGRIFLWAAAWVTLYLGPAAPASPGATASRQKEGLLDFARRLQPAWAQRVRTTAEQTIAAQPSDVRLGYVDENNHLLPGHLTAWIFAGLTLVVYAIGYQVASPDAKLFGVGEPFEVPAMAFVLVLLLLVTWLLTSVAFFLDGYRISTVAALVAVPFALFFLHDIDFYYELPHSAAKPATFQGSLTAVVKSRESAEQHDIRDALRARMKRSRSAATKGTDPIVVIVAASGGGMTAAYWTAQVLTGLQTDFGASFTNSIYFVSAVSGGSAGAMFYLNDLQPTRVPDQDRVMRQAAQSSLPAVAWGLVYPDFWRNFALRSPKDKKIDRGWALEEAWTRVLGSTPMLSDWRSEALRGERPVVAFNATVAETGQRLIFSNLRINTIPPECGVAGALASARCEDAIDGATAWSLYPDYDLPVLRAARLSAAFPFVSPIARPLAVDDENTAYHVADGGYYDNFGIVTSVEWLRNVARVWRDIADSQKIGNPHVLLIEIRESDYREGDAKPAARRAGWTYAFTGPIATMLQVRRSSQAARNDLDLSLFQESAAAMGWTVNRAVFVLRSDAPMSWQLSQSERDDIWHQWTLCRTSPATLVGRGYAEVAKVFGSAYAHNGHVDPRCATSVAQQEETGVLHKVLATAPAAMR